MMTQQDREELVRRLGQVIANGGDAALQTLAAQMAERPMEERREMLDQFLAGREVGLAAARVAAARDAVRSAGRPSGSRGAGRLSPGRAMAPSPASEIRVTSAADIRAEEIAWLWEGRVPLGMLSLWAGAPKVGKSFVSLSLAAAVSRGSGPPDGVAPDGPASVLLMSAEDDPARTILPRLRAAGADLARIHLLESNPHAHGARGLPSLRDDIERIEAAADNLGDCRLIVIDPISAYLGADEYRNTGVRAVLSPLKSVAERLGAAVVLLSHLTKSSSGSVQRRVIGSVAYVGVCRANFLFARDGQDPSGRRALMLDIGGNVAGKAPTLAYAIEDRDDGPRVEWQPETVEITAEEAIAAERRAARQDRASPERREAEEWLRDVLARGPILARDIEAAGRAAGFSGKILRSAKEAIGAESVKDGYGLDARWIWRAPEPAAQ